MEKLEPINNMATFDSRAQVIPPVQELNKLIAQGNAVEIISKQGVRCGFNRPITVHMEALYG